MDEEPASRIILTRLFDLGALTPHGPPQLSYCGWTEEARSCLQLRTLLRWGVGNGVNVSGLLVCIFIPVLCHFVC